MSIINKHKRTYGILLVNLLLLITGIIIYNKSVAVIQTDKEERLLTKINLHIDSVLISVKDAQRGERGYIISGDKSYLQTFFNAEKRLDRILDDLDSSLQKQNFLGERYTASKKLIKNAFSKFNEIIQIREGQGAALDTLKKLDYEGKKFIDTLQNNINVMENYEKAELNLDAKKSLDSLTEIVFYLIVSGIIVGSLVIILSISLVRDIFKREELTLKLEGSEKKYNFLFELSADGIVVADLNGIITDCNSAACKIFGYSKKELIGKSYHIIWPENKKHLLPDRIDKNTITGDTIIERVYVRKDGTILSAEVYTKLIEINGLSSVVAHVRDITDKKNAQKAIIKSEEKYRKLFERSLAGIFRTTVDGQIIECNNEFANILGYDSIDDIKRISTKSFYANPNDRIKLVELLKARKEVKEYLMKLKKKNGSYVWVYDSVSLIYDEDLKTEVLFGTMLDITTQIEAEKEIKLLAHSLESISECVSITDANNIILYVNESFVKTYGFEKNELKGQHISVVQSKLNIASDIQKKILYATHEGGWKGELVNKRKDGTNFPVYLSTSVVKDSDNNPLALIGVAMDITERKQAEETLRKSEQKYKDIFTWSPIGIYQSRLDGTFLTVNGSLVKILGYESTSELIQKNMQKDIYFYEKERSELISKYDNSEAGAVFDIEVLWKKKDNSPVWISMTAHAIKNIEGKTIYYEGFVHDVTNRKRDEEEIKRLNRIYALLSNINQAIVRTKNRKQLLSNACKIAIDDGKFKMSWIGLIDEQSGELKAVAADGFIDGYLDEVILESKNYPFGIKPVSEIFNTGKPLIFNNVEILDESVFWRKPALERGYKSNAVFPLIVLGEIVGNLSLFSDQIDFFEEKEIHLLSELSEDISFALETMEIEKKRKESESLFYTLANNSPVGIFRTRTDGYTTYVNPKWCQLSGIKAERARGDGWLTAVHPEDKNKLIEEWKKASDEQRQSLAEYRFVHTDGSISWVMGQAIPELNIKNEIEGYVGTITDITRIKNFEKELTEAKNLAEKSDRMKSQFMAQMSHEIRTPINIMLGNIEYINEAFNSQMDDEVQDSFASIELASKRIIRTIDLILNVSELQTVGYKPEFKKINLHYDVLNKLFNEHRRLAEQKRLEFIYKFEKDFEIVGDEYSIIQIFANLIDNAIQFTKKGKIEIHLLKNNSGKIEVNVKDTGIGMGKQFLEKMFEPFMQEDQGYSRQFEGNGLGLTLVKNYCEINKADIKVESQKDVGSLFKVIFTTK